VVRYFGDKDSTTRVLLERILAQEEEHANDMHDPLVSHEGRPMLEKFAADGGATHLTSVPNSERRQRYEHSRT